MPADVYLRFKTFKFFNNQLKTKEMNCVSGKYMLVKKKKNMTLQGLEIVRIKLIAESVFVQLCIRNFDLKLI